ncbi:MAG: hypothetical protein R3D68_19995 [Hyphomicrobiaceae bacterium]
MNPKAIRRSCVVLTLAIGSSLLSGCSAGEGVELNGKIFDALGVSGNVLGKKVEPKTEARAPLVIPPDTTRLPAPDGAPVTTAALPDQQSWPNDPDKARAQQAAAKKQAQAEYCRDGNWKDRAKGDEMADNGCNQGSLFGVMGKTLFGNSD